MPAAAVMIHPRVSLEAMLERREDGTHGPSSAGGWMTRMEVEAEMAWVGTVLRRTWAEGVTKGCLRLVGESNVLAWH
jgi:hypothetical protein